MTAEDKRTPWQKDVDEWLAQQEVIREQQRQQARKDVEEKMARGERVLFLSSYASDKWQKYERFDPKDKDHLETELLHPKWVFESEVFGKLLNRPLAIEADLIIDKFQAKHGRLPHGVVAKGAPPPDDFNLPDPTIEDVLIKKLVTVLAMSKQSLQNTEPRAVINATLKSLQQLQTLDGKFPQSLTTKSLHGILGDFVEIAHPTIVANREMLLYEMLPLIGVVLGDAYYLGFGSDKHFPSIFTLSIGRTSDGKGQAWHACKEAIELVDLPSICTKPAIHSDCSSGEALVRMLGGGQITLEGARRKKVGIFTTEMSIWFVAQGRKGSNLSGYLRKAYDGDLLENFRSDKSKSMIADNYLLGFCGTITPKELREIMPLLDWSNGAQNRFLWSIGARDKDLGRSTKRANFQPWAERVKKLVALNANTQSTAIEYSESGKRVWDDWHHSLPEHDDSILADSQARCLANCARIANLYAQLDERRLSGWKVQLEAQHVEAAIEIVNRSRQSVEWYLAQQMGSTQKVNYEDIQKLKSAMVKKARDGGVAELTGTEVYELFRHRTRDERDAICMAAGFKPSHRALRGGGLVWTQ